MIANQTCCTIGRVYQWGTSCPSGWLTTIARIISAARMIANNALVIYQLVTNPSQGIIGILGLVGAIGSKLEAVRGGYWRPRRGLPRNLGWRLLVARQHLHWLRVHASGYPWDNKES
jgi:hypothetical protein